MDIEVRSLAAVYLLACLIFKERRVSIYYDVYQYLSTIILKMVVAPGLRKKRESSKPDLTTQPPDRSGGMLAIKINPIRLPPLGVLVIAREGLILFPLRSDPPGALFVAGGWIRLNDLRCVPRG